MTEDISYDLLPDSYKSILFSVSAIAKDFYSILREVHEESIISNNGYGQAVFDRLLERANSELLSIAFFGAFSSGKSFLISALNNQVNFVTDERGEYYTSLLPASSLPTTSCPVAVEPLPTKETEHKFWVYFEDQPTQGEQKSPVIPAIIQAYVTSLPNSLPNRISQKDQRRTVYKAKLGIASAALRARLYDLPGIGAIDKSHDKTVREFVQQADCLVYIAWAQRPLSNDDLELLRHVYEHHKRTGKPVFFVLTQIDRNDKYEPTSGKTAWEDVRDANNEFLKRFFCTEDGKPDVGFIGKGFIAISAALEAKAKYLSLVDSTTSKAAHNASQMDALRSLFDEYLKTTSGPMHLVELTAEIQKLLLRLNQDIQARNEAESTPRDQLLSSIRGYKEKRSVLIEGISGLREQLADLGRAAIDRAFSKTDADKLANLLDKRLRDKILSSDILKEEVIHQIETEKMAIVREWVIRDRSALIPSWERSWSSFIRQTDERIENLLVASTEAQQARGKESDQEDGATLEIRPPRPPSPNRELLGDTLAVISKAWQTYATIATVGGVTGGLATFTAAFPMAAALGPVGWALFATALFGGGVARYKMKKQLKERRKAMLENNLQYAREVVESYRTQAIEFTTQRTGQLLEVLSDEIDRLENLINTLEQRKQSGEFIDAERRLRTLNSLAERSQDTEGLILKFFNDAAKLQPGMEVLALPKLEEAV